MTIRINGSNPTFRLATEKVAAPRLAPLDPLMEDLLNVAAAVFAADSSVARGGATRPDMGADWRRQFAFEIPVQQAEFWSRSDIINALVDAVSFLTDDDVTFRFVQSPEEVKHQGYLDFDMSKDPFVVDEVILFSGGLDSFAGALEALSTRNGRVALVTHRSAQKVIPRQQRLGQYLARRFPGRVLHVQVEARRVGAEAKESTQRSRSFLFASLGQVVARLLRAKQVSFYENGVVSQNLPFSPQVIGTMATRTTHPLALLRLGQLMNLIGTEAVPIVNPFAWLTKTDIVERIARYDGTSMIGDAVSCTSIRDQDTLHTHCGACSQCLDRRLAILAAGLEEYDPPEMYRTDVMHGARTTDRSRTMAVDWTRHALRLSKMEARDFMDAFGLELVRILAGYPDESRSDVLRRCLDLQKRQANLVVNVLKRSVIDQADALSLQLLPATCLLVQHVAGGNGLTLPDDPRIPRVPALTVGAGSGEQSDVVPDPDQPLEVTFVEEGHLAIVIVRGLCRVEGSPARVAHVLKVSFDEDREAGRPRTEHRYRKTGEIGQNLTVGKDAVAQNVKRCRQKVKQAFFEVHGRKPGKDLLIETRRGHGYRLDPDLRIVATGN